jgi:4-amino-4-deoxy-L-arabinose transferase-like glycosyltransferase
LWKGIKHFYLIGRKIFITFGALDLKVGKMDRRTSAVRNVSKYWELIVIVALCIMGVILILYFTRSSPRMSGDSVWYVMGADNILAGNGYSRTSGGGEIKPITGFPPFFSIVLAGLGTMGLDLIEGSRWVNALIFGASAFLTWRLIHQYTGSKWVSLAGAVLFLGSSSLIKYHSWVMSEGLYILLQLTVFSLLIAYINSEKKILWLLAAVITGFGILTKYVGFSLLISGALTIFFFGEKDRKKTIINSLLYIFIASLPVVVWFMRNSALQGSLTNRAFSYHPIRLDLLEIYKYEIGNWFLLHRLIAWGRRFLIAALIAVIGPLYFIYAQIKEWRSKQSLQCGKARALPWLLIFNTLAFLMILIMNSLFLDAGTTPSAPERYLAPLYVTSIILILITTYDLITYSRIKTVLAPTLAAVLISITFLHIQNSFDLYGENGVDLGYKSLMMENPSLVAGLRDISQDRFLYSDNVERVYVLTGRTAYFLPVKYNVYAQQPNPDFPDQIAQASRVLQTGGRLIIFGNVDEELELRNVIDHLEVVILEAFPGATVYGYVEN